MRRSILCLLVMLFLSGCRPAHLPPSITPSINRDRAEAIALDVASKGMPEVDVAQDNHPLVLEARLTTLTRAVMAIDPLTHGDTGGDDPNQQVWLVTFEGSWQSAFPRPKTTPAPTAVLYNRCQVILKASTGEVMRSHFYPSPSVNSTAAPTSPPENSLTPATEVLFPLTPGTTWTYTHAGYSQAPDHPDQIIHGTSQTQETVADTQRLDSVVIAHIRGKKTMLQADPGWQENGTFPLGDYEYWYVLQNNSLYLSYTRPDPDQLQTFQMIEEYHFPLEKGASWCPGKEEVGYLTPPAQTPVPCAYAGKRTVTGGEGSWLSTVGKFDRCYQLQDAYNSGGVVQWFCEGVGRVAQKYDHAGSQFGFSEELTAFTPGTLSSRTPSPDQTPSIAAATDQATLTPSAIPAAWATARAALPADIPVNMPSHMPARFGPPQLLEVVAVDPEYGPHYTILYEALENKPEESVVFILNIGKGAWGNTPPPDSTEPIAIDGMSGKLYYSNSQSTSGNPEYVATWQDQGQHYEIKAPSARITREEMMQILDSLVPLGKTPEPTPASPVPSATGTASTPSGRIAFVSDRDGYTAMAIFTIRPDGSGLTQITKGLGVIFYLAWSPDGKWLAFDVCPAPNGECADGNSDIYRVDTDGSNLRNLTHHPAFDSHPAWSPDGRFLVFDSNRSGQTALYRMAADGSDLRLVASGEMDIKEPTWSGNGSQIAANCTRWSTTDITTNTCLWPAEGGGPAVEFAGVGPVWSPVGLPGSMRVAVGRDRDHVTDIFSVRPDGGDAVNLTANPSNNFGPVWSPDGQWILFISNRSGSIDLYKVCAACPQGTPTLRLTADGLNHNFPVWSPDGGWIADLTGQTDETRLEIRRADGSGSRILTDQVKWSLAWQPKAP